MKTLAILAVAMAMKARAGAEEVAIYLEGQYVVPIVTLARAKSLTDRMFASAGVRIDWLKGEPSHSQWRQQPIIIKIVKESSRDIAPGALAFALSYEGVHVTLFYDRIQQTIEPALVDRLLAHVMAHEITHILQGVGRHSETGIMKAHWTPDDLNAMKLKPLSFTEEDVRLIRIGLEKRTKTDST